MAEPIVFISRHRIKEGRLEGFEQYFRQGAASIEASKPRTVAWLAYLNDSGTEVTIVHVFPDAESLDLHMEGAVERAKGAYEYVEPISIEIYGAPSDGAMQTFSRATESRIALTANPKHLAGYLRLTPA